MSVIKTFPLKYIESDLNEIGNFADELGITKEKFMKEAINEKMSNMDKKIYQGYYCDSYSESGLYEREEMKGYPQFLILDDILNKNMNGKKIRIIIEELEED